MSDPEDGDDPRTSQRRRIVEAAAGLLAAQGVRALTTRAVAEAAGVQAPTIYRLFDDKDGLLDAVAEHQMAAYVAASADEVAATASGDDPVAELRRAWQVHLDFGLAHPDLYALMTAPGRAGWSAATAAGIEVLRTRVRRVAAAGLLGVDEHRAVAMIHAAGSGAVLSLLALPVPQRDPGLSAALCDAVLGAVLVTAPVVADRTTVATAVAFGAVVDDLPGLSAAERAVLGEWVGRSVAALTDV